MKVEKEWRDSINKKEHWVTQRCKRIDDKKTMSNP